jgi:hypothetical protein
MFDGSGGMAVLLVAQKSGGKGLLEGLLVDDKAH